MFETEYALASCQWVIVVYGNYSAISRREQVTFQWDEDEVPTRLFVLFFAFCVFFFYSIPVYIYILKMI